MSDQWVVHWSPRAERFARKLGKGPVRDRIRKEIDSLSSHPKRGKYFPNHDVPPTCPTCGMTGEWNL